MKKSQMSRIADRVGTSPATVSRAINHCPGVGTELREQILAMAAEEGIIGKVDSDTDVYVILPDIPVYFWGSLRECLASHLATHGITAKYNVYSRLGDRDTVERYLNEAAATEAAVVLIAAKYEGLDERLARMTAERAVFSVAEYTEAPNVCFIGSDREADGRLMAERVLADHPDLAHILLVGNDLARTAGFMRAAGGRVLHTLTPNREASAAELARDLDRLQTRTPMDAIIGLDGNMPRLCSAMTKCKLEIPFYGFEQGSTDDRYADPIGLVCQDLDGIARAAALATAHYVRKREWPDTKYTFIPSIYRERQR